MARVLVNTPATFGALGITTNLFPAMTLGSGSAGRGSTSDNVSPMNLVYIRKVGYGVRTVEDMFTFCNNGSAAKQNEQPSAAAAEHADCTEELDKLRDLLDHILETH